MSVINQKEYLKKYLSVDKKRKKKKVKAGSATKSKFRIIEDVINVSALPFGKNIVTEEELGEDAPQIAEIIDERPEHIKREEIFKSTGKWRAINDSADDTASRTGNTLEANSMLERRKLPTTRIARHDSDSDLSPERRNRSQNPSSSLPRRSRNDSDPDLSPPRRAKNDSDPDLSPPRARKVPRTERDVAPRSRHDSDSDLSPPRPKTSADAPGSKKNSRSSSQSSSQRHGSESRKRGSHKGRARDRSSSEDRSKRDSSGNLEKGQKTLSGLKAGLQDSSNLRKELMEIREKESRLLAKIGDELSGKGAETIFRDKKTGKKRDLKEERRKQREEEQLKAQQQEKYMEWGKGLKQGEEQAKRLEDDLYEMSKPLARYSDDVDLENRLKEQDREGDPMLEYIKKKKSKDQSSSKPKFVYQGPPPPPNRFNIQPGYRWDGVDRSNGFETKYFKQQTNKQALSEDAYKWSVQDM